MQSSRNLSLANAAISIFVLLIWSRVPESQSKHLNDDNEPILKAEHFKKSDFEDDRSMEEDDEDEEEYYDYIENENGEIDREKRDTDDEYVYDSAEDLLDPDYDELEEDDDKMGGKSMFGGLRNR